MEREEQKYAKQKVDEIIQSVLDSDKSTVCLCIPFEYIDEIFVERLKEFINWTYTYTDNITGRFYEIKKK